MEATKLRASDLQELLVSRFQERFYPQYQATYENFEDWCKEYNRTYSSEKEKHYRFKVFKKRYATVTRHNQIGNSGSELSLNDFADLSWVELAQLREGRPSPMILG
ncbi:cathepsin propeptide inhibitor domain protein [Medicago truncatula]|uniref:Cathepsin propeptide inhibitor domain protein n=2 Tax=Medicago truncatula TaxID=3880 RepID=G7L0I2_MEDTR|nr:cathepsin propeptide inhibitor domain protein [Medicago truncatula]